MTGQPMLHPMCIPSNLIPTIQGKPIYPTRFSGLRAALRQTFFERSTNTNKRQARLNQTRSTHHVCCIPPHVPNMLTSSTSMNGPLKMSILLLVALVSTTMALKPPAQAWITFCDDTNCSKNCGMSLSINNPGCVNQRGRGSYWIDGVIGWDEFSLIVSPDLGCPCQTKCMSGMSGDQHRCVALHEEEYKGDSYRFITGGCPRNTACPE